MKECACEGWKEHSHEIIKELCKFCPYCGEEIQEGLKDG